MAQTGIINAALNLILPPRCPTCGDLVDDDLQFCGTCWGNIRFISEPACRLCSRPFDPQLQQDRADTMVCANCLTFPPVFDGLKAVAVYDDLSRQIVLKLKHGGRIGLAKMIARFLERHFDVLDDDILLIPVPLHRWRIWRRGFNQSLLIARELALLRGLLVADNALIRTRATPPLQGLSAKQRAETVRTVFAVPDTAKPCIKGRHIALIDDVFTTGATANACVRLLKKNGAASVTILCWARVFRDGEEGVG